MKRVTGDTKEERHAFRKQGKEAEKGQRKIRHGFLEAKGRDLSGNKK